MNKIEEKKHRELVTILSELIETIVLMKEKEKDYLLIQNENEARDWLEFLKKHKDKDELKSLENEISDRFFLKFDVQIRSSELDNKRAELTDISKVLSRGIYKAYNLQREILIEYEKSLMLMLDKTDFDVYLVCLYLTSQLFKEKNELSPFTMDKSTILKRLGEEIEKRKPNIRDGIIYPSGYKNTKVWEELERFNMVCKEEYHVLLF